MFRGDEVESEDEVAADVRSPEVSVSVAIGDCKRGFRIDGLYLGLACENEPLFAVVGFNPDVFTAVDADVPNGFAGKPSGQWVSGELTFGEDVELSVLLPPETGVLPAERLIIDIGPGWSTVGEIGRYTVPLQDRILRQNPEAAGPVQSCSSNRVVRNTIF